MDKIQTLSELLETNIVEIPIVQRDYAQGRKDEHATLVRSNLLSDIKDAVLGVTTTLDLVLLMFHLIIGLIDLNLKNLKKKYL